MGLKESEKIRYSRQIMVKGWGEAAQLKVKSARVAVIGVGGLGSPASLYLAASGVGYLRLIDCDTVDLSNLNRQILHWSTDLGRPKVESAAMKLTQLNPEIAVDPVNEALTVDNVAELLKGIDVVVDGLDNLQSRFIVNEACVSLRIPYVYGAVYGMEGFLTTIVPGEGPCLRCIYPSASATAEAFPVVGTAPGVIGSLEASEALKLITGIGKPAIERLIIYDGELMRFDEIAIKKDEGCPVCSRQKPIR
ncbi:MAG: HesA/MoeB/ThiF family protein [Candidatus Methanosuratincola sp.]|jgi:adenylyltransferase/sulfurtransferase|uniref:HesA/MoeB/ThiF family protein n=1 Tax=Candidatus Methanosuratincola petrocarbonis (ex Vanwonterghem et al. 2016) TaxID=1867261 RepID=A0A7J3UZR3_9CREN|nr:HesA/MoeB/ThiF family protein [Candidatus Methanosuratincola sp.]